MLGTVLGYERQETEQGSQQCIVRSIMNCTSIRICYGDQIQRGGDNWRNVAGMDEIYSMSEKMSLCRCARRVLHGTENQQVEGRGTGFVGSEVCTNVGTLSKKKNIKSRIQNLVRK